MAGLEVTLKARGLKAAQDAMRDAPARFLEQVQAGLAAASDDLLERFVAATPLGEERGQPHMRDQWRTEGSGMERRITNPTPQASYLFTGTRPHSIDPVQGTMLRFMVGGRWVYARHVEHPGTARNEELVSVAQSAAAVAREHLRSASATALGFISRDIAAGGDLS